MYAMEDNRKPQSTTISFRTTPRLRELAEKQAAKLGLTLAEWLRHLMVNSIEGANSATRKRRNGHGKKRNG